MHILLLSDVNVKPFIIFISNDEKVPIWPKENAKTNFVI